MRNLLKNIDPDLAEMILDAHEKGVKTARLLAKESQAQRMLREEIDRFSYDMTGQDGEEEIGRASHDYADAQQERFESQYNEDQLQEMLMGA